MGEQAWSNADRQVSRQLDQPPFQLAHLLPYLIILFLLASLPVCSLAWQEVGTAFDKVLSLWNIDLEKQASRWTVGEASMSEGRQTGEWTGKCTSEYIAGRTSRQTGIARASRQVGRKMGD